jgi:hypothetical protein
MGVRFSHLAFGAAALFPWTVATSAWAQTWSVSITPANLGKVAMPNSTSTFHIHPNGAVVTQTGSGIFVGGAPAARALVTVGCTGTTTCNNTHIKVVITRTTPVDAPVSSLTSFTVAMSDASLAGSAPSPASSITFTLNPISKNTSKSFYVGMDMAVLGSGSSTGPGAGPWTVTVSNTSGHSAASSATSTQITSLRPIGVTKSSDLAFGVIVKPASGSGTVTMAPGGGMSFTNGIINVGDHAPALFKITGEGGAAFSFSLQPTMTMSAGAGTSLLVTTIGSGTYTLGSTLGASGTTSLAVGGSFPLSSTTKSAHYSGSFSVLAIYN